LYCHDPDSDTATFTTASVFKSKHGRRADAHSPFGPGGMQCEACHGPGANHSIKDSKKIPTINSQKANSFMTPAQRNEACLACHKGSARNAWHSGAHGQADLACASCHQIHTGSDKVMAKATEAEVCFKCHKQQRAELNKASAHPVRQGRMACSDCHNPHGSNAVAMLNQPTLNQTCFNCHAEKRGPVLWEHAPVAEDCALCHKSHGSVRAGLLTKAAPLLCQDCHTVAGHPSVPRTASGLPGGGSGGAIFITAGSCLNCHTQVHGSNHPAGAKLMR
jgi:DmsE family decaheme c-type cytochrome